MNLVNIKINLAEILSLKVSLHHKISQQTYNFGWQNNYFNFCRNIKFEKSACIIKLGIILVNILITLLKKNDKLK